MGSRHLRFPATGSEKGDPLKAKHLVWIRRISQTFFLFLFLFLLVQSRLPQDVFHEYSLVFSSELDLKIGQPVAFFFQLDPLVWLSSLLSGHQLIKGFWWGLGLVLMTLFLGRIFCGFICPLGTIHHVVSWIKPALKGERMVHANQKSPSQRVKYFLLITLLLGAIIGLNIAGLMDPISLLFRSIALAVLPGLGVGVKALFDWMANSDIKVLNLLSYGGEVLVSPVFGYSYQSYQTAWFIGLIFLVILFLNRIRPRFLRQGRIQSAGASMVHLAPPRVRHPRRGLVRIPSNHRTAIDALVQSDPRQLARVRCGPDRPLVRRLPADASRVRAVAVDGNRPVPNGDRPGLRLSPLLRVGRRYRSAWTGSERIPL